MPDVAVNKASNMSVLKCARINMLLATVNQAHLALNLV